jgi:hypothetical protein
LSLPTRRREPEPLSLRLRRQPSPPPLSDLWRSNPPLLPSRTCRALLPWLHRRPRTTGNFCSRLRRRVRRESPPSSTRRSSAPNRHLRDFRALEFTTTSRLAPWIQSPARDGTRRAPTPPRPRPPSP